METDNRQSTKDDFIGVASLASLIIANIIGVRRAEPTRIPLNHRRGFIRSSRPRCTCDPGGNDAFPSLRNPATQEILSTYTAKMNENTRELTMHRLKGNTCCDRYTCRATIDNVGLIWLPCVATFFVSPMLNKLTKYLM